METGASSPEIHAPPAPSRFIRSVIETSTVLLCGVGTALLTGDRYCAAAGAALLSAVFIVALDGLFVGRLLRLSRWRELARAVIALMWTILLLWFCHVDRNSLFARAFGSPPPSAVHDLVVDLYTGPHPSGRTVLMRFTADRNTIEQLLRTRGFKPHDPVFFTEWQSHRNWNDLWKHTFAPFSEQGGKAWRDVEPMREPQVHSMSWPSEGGTIQTIVLWDAGTGRVYVLCEIP